MEHQDTKLTSMRPRLKELNDNPYLISMERTQLSQTVKGLRKEFGMTQEELAMKSGVGLNFVRNLEQGKATLRMDKVNQLLDLFNYTLVAAPRFNEG